MCAVLITISFTACICLSSQHLTIWLLELDFYLSVKVDPQYFIEAAGILVSVVQSWTAELWMRVKGLLKNKENGRKLFALCSPHYVSERSWMLCFCCLGEIQTPPVMCMYVMSLMNYQWRYWGNLTHNCKCHVLGLSNVLLEITT